MLRPDLQENQPYCSNCGYELTGAVESSKCPECGRPLVEVLTRNTTLSGTGRRYRSRATLFGLPILDIATGPRGSERFGRARGIIAIGDVATGFIAIGGWAIGIVAVGGLAVGLCSLGGGAIGLLTALGGAAIGTMACGGLAIGILANGGAAVGVLAQGGGAFGVHARGGGNARGMRFTSSPPIFEQFAWFFGGWPGVSSMFEPLLVIGAINIAVAGIIGLLAWRAWQKYEAKKRAAAGSSSAESSGKTKQ